MEILTQLLELTGKDPNPTPSWNRQRDRQGLTPDLYAAQPDYIESLAAFVRGRPAQPVEAFMQQSDAVIAHDVESHLGKITAPTQITFGQHDMITSTRFAERIQNALKAAELIVFEGCAHAPIYEKVDEFNDKTLEFLQRHSG